MYVRRTFLNVLFHFPSIESFILPTLYFIIFAHRRQHLVVSRENVTIRLLGKRCCTSTRVHVFGSPGQIDVSLSIPEAAQCAATWHTITIRETSMPPRRECYVRVHIYIYMCVCVCVCVCVKRGKEEKKQREERVSTAMQEERIKKVSGRERSYLLVLCHFF